MKRMNVFALGAFSALVSVAQAHDWPCLDTEKPVHKTIMSSILGRPGEDYLGGQYNSQRYVIQGAGVDDQFNGELYAALPRLRRALVDGQRIQLMPVGTADEVRRFEHHILYKILVDGEEQPYRFSLYNRSKLHGFKSFKIPEHAEAPQQLVPGLPRVRPGHGIRPWDSNVPNHSVKGCVSDATIDALIQKHHNHRVLKHAFQIMAGADIAVVSDMKKLLSSIRTHNQRINKQHLFDKMMADRDLLTSAALSFDKGADLDSIFRPGYDQLCAFSGHTAKNLGYRGRDVILHARNMIEKYPEMLSGIMPDELKNASGRAAIELRVALIYIARAKALAAGVPFSLDQFATLYKGNYFGHNHQTLERLKNTAFYQDGYFFTPDNGYIKNSDQVRPVTDLAGLDIGPWQPLENLEMHFADCSGFIQHVARKVSTRARGLNKRVMSYHLAALYDVLANKHKGTQNGMYDVHGKYARELTADEKKNREIYKSTIDPLAQVYAPVMNPAQNMQPGDIIVECNADGSEGHVVFYVDKDPAKPGHIIVVELTGFGGSRGYKWRSIELANAAKTGAFHRVLRLQQ